jgi:hypothetical protein
MGLQRINCQGTGTITPGVTQINQANSGLPSVNPNGSAAGIYANLPATDPIYGRTIGWKVSAGAGVTFDARMNAAASVTKGAVQLLLWFTGAPTTADNDFSTMRGTVQNTGLRLKTTGSGRPLALGSEITGSGNYDNLGTGKFILVDQYFQSDSTAANGTQKWRWWDLAGAGGLTTPDFSATATGQALGDSDTQFVLTSRVGKLSSTAVMPDFYIADWRFDDTASDFITTPTFLAASLSDDSPPDVTHRVNIVMTSKVSGGAPPITSHLSQTSGPAVTLVQDSALVWHFDDVTRSTDIVLSNYYTDSGAGTTIGSPRTITIAPGTGLTEVVYVGAPEVAVGGSWL